VILEKSCSETSQQKETTHGSKNASMSQQKCVDVAAKMLRSQDALHIYLKKLIIKEIVKTNSSLNYEFFVLISLLNFQVEIDSKYSDQEDKILSQSYPR
jgi:G:T/U-mismatch repair DNA glycosylase